MINKKRLLNTFLDLIKIDSSSLHERNIVVNVKERLLKMGLRVSEDSSWKKIGGEAGNIWAMIKGNVKGAPRILLNAHLDTVSPCKGLRTRIRNGYVYSDGTTILGADNKAGVAVILEAIKALKESRIPHGEIKILFTVAEEIGLCGAQFLPKEALDADMGFTLDGGDVDKIIDQAPSQDTIEARIIGKAAHAGVRPEVGINAIKVASEAIAKMRLGRIDRETTSNIGVIKGGTATNIVPEKVIIKGEARSHDPKKLKAQVAHMKKCLSAACKKHKAQLKIRVFRAYNAFKIKRGHPAIGLAEDALRSLGIKPVVKMTGGGSDANIFNSRSLSTIILGAGADSVHTSKERLSIRQMGMSALMVLEIIKGAAHGKK